MPTYEEWQDLLFEWMSRHKSIYCGAMELIEACRQQGVKVSEATLRKHVRGEYNNVSLELARATWDYMRNETTDTRATEKTEETPWL